MLLLDGAQEGRQTTAQARTRGCGKMLIPVTSIRYLQVTEEEISAAAGGAEAVRLRVRTHVRAAVAGQQRTKPGIHLLI
jgi:hypothetical protein